MKCDIRTRDGGETKVSREVGKIFVILQNVDRETPKGEVGLVKAIYD